MKKYLSQIIGKTIQGIVWRENNFRPDSQLFLLFSDGTHYELYCHNGLIEGSKSLGEGLNIEHLNFKERMSLKM